MIRMIALDVDGTLLTSQGTVSGETLRAVRMARERGIRVVLATGRSVPEAVWLTQLVGCDQRAVCIGGAVVADMADGRHLKRWDIRAETARPVLELLRGRPLFCMVFAGEVNVLDRASDAFFQANYPYPAYLDHTVAVDDVPAWLYTQRLPLTKIHAEGDPEVFPALLEQLRQLPGLTLTSSGRDNFEVVADGVDKGRALCLLGSDWGIRPEEIAAIGDSDNDLAMLRAVGCPVAMGNASAEVKAAARLVTADNDRDGVAKAIYQLI